VTRALYVCQTGMTEPLGRSQVLPYVRGLARAGFEMELVGFEPAAASEEEARAVAAELRGDGIRYRYARRSPSHATAVKAREAAGALTRLLGAAVARRPRIIHARSTLCAAVAYAAARVTPGARFLFDCRGLLGDEYVDAGHWRRGSLPYWITQAAERALFARANAVVVLTDRLKRWLMDTKLVPPFTPVVTIPCCVDLARFTAAPGARVAARAELGAGERFVLGYAGTLGSWYCEDEMAQLFAALRRRRPALFAIFTQARTERMRAALAAQRVPETDVVVRAVPPLEMPRMLAAADAAVSFIRPCFSKIASSPTKIAEYLAMGLPVAMNRNVGDGDAQLCGGGPLVDAGTLLPGDLAAAADRLLAQASAADTAREARRLSQEWFGLEEVGVARYADLYARLTQAR
jgi:glycosyltransferase involved in cell wall biosynthesis